MNILERINWLKWQIKLRLPGGGIYERVMATTFNKQELLEDELKVFYYWLNRYQSIYKTIYKGVRFTDEEIDEFYDWLDKYYLTTDKTHYSILLDATSIRVPIPSYEYRRHYKTQIFDLIFSYRIGYPENPRVPFYEGPYEYGNVKVEKNDLVLDVGANYGLFSAYASSKGAKVIAFEPNEQICDLYLSQTARLNPNIDIVRKAICDVVGDELFHVDGVNPGGSCLVGDELYYDNITVVQTDTLDNICQGLNQLDFIKADIEGAELRLLDGARRVIQEFKPNLAICRYHNLFDTFKITKRIKEIDPSYEIEHKWMKTYAHSPKKCR